MAIDLRKLKTAVDLPGLLLGFQILLEGWGRMPDFNRFPLPVIFLFLAGLFVVFGTLLRHRLEKRLKKIDALFHFTQGAVLIVSALILMEQGKIRIPMIILFTGFIYLILGLLSYHMNETNREQLGRRFMIGLGAGIMAAGLVLLAYTLNHDRDPWALGFSAFFLILGALYAFFGKAIVRRLSPKGKYSRSNADATESGKLDANP